jgi:alpha-1,6-mannosyltransferase
LVSAVGLRMLCVGAPLVWSDDVYRYLWEGKLVLQGGNPFVDAPSQFSIVDGVREHVNHPEISTVYPPLAQLFFSGVAWCWYHPMMVQVCAGIADVGTTLAIWTWLKRNNQSVQGAWLYALHPLPIIETAWSGHLESIAVCCMAWGMVGHSGWGKWIWFIGGWCKLFPFVFLGFVRKWHVYEVIAMLMVSAILLGLFWDDRALTGLNTYAQHWSYNASLYALASWVSASWGRLICMVAMILSAGFHWWMWLKHRYSIDRVLYGLGVTFILCSPTVHPWYALWLVVPMLMLSNRISRLTWGLWMSLLPLTYVSLFTVDPLTGAWSPPLWPTILSYILPFLLWITLQIRSSNPKI